MTWKRLFAHQALLTVFALTGLVSAESTWTGTGMSGYVWIALPFAAYLMGMLVAGFEDKGSQ